MQPIDMIIYINLSFIWIVKSNTIISQRSTQITRSNIDRIYTKEYQKDQIIANVFGGKLSVSFRQNLLYC